MTFLAGVLLWALIVLAYAACLRAAGWSRPRSKGVQAVLLLTAAGLALLLGRPDEEVMVGEDAGSYFNAALAFARHQSLAVPDEALDALPVSERALFRYGHHGFLWTKDHVFWADNAGFEKVGPRFFPAYSLLLSVPCALGFPYAAFWLSSLLAVLLGGLLALLAAWLTGRPWAGWIALALFILHPAVIWNARSLRAEWPAALLVFTGLVIWAAHHVMRRKVTGTQAFLGGLALAAASWFHVTAVYVLIPALGITAWQMRRDRFQAGWAAGLAAGIAGTLVQVLWVADPYQVLNLWASPARRPFLLAAGLSALAGMFVLRRAGKRMSKRCLAWFRRAPRLAGMGPGALVVLAVLLAIRYRGELGLLPGLPPWTTAYISLTDFGGVARLFSRTGFAAALAGLVFLGVREGPGGRLGRWLCVWLAPASLTIGWVYNYMFETRRMVTFLVPFFVLAVANLVVLLGEAVAKAYRRLSAAAGMRPPRPVTCRALATGGAALLAAMLLLAGFRGRSQLYTTWNHRGAYRFFSGLAAELSARGDFLFAEYTQTAVPLERFSGLPLLPIAWGYRSDEEYRAAEKVIERLVSAYPQRRHLLVSPFAGTAIPGVSLEPLFERTLDSRTLGRARESVPGQVHAHVLTLYAYRLLPSGRGAAGQAFTRHMDGSRLGVEGSANFMPNRSVTMQGVALPEGTYTPVVVDLPRETQAGRLYMMFARLHAGQPAEIAVDAPDTELVETGFFSPAPGWEGFEAALTLSSQSTVALRFKPSHKLFLTDLFWVEDGQGAAQRVHARQATTPFHLHAFDSQWLRASSAFVIPPAERPRWLWFLASRGGEDSEKATAAFHQPDERIPAVIFPVCKDWHWYLVPLAAGTHASPGWHALRVDPPWDPELDRFPSDLGLRIHLLATHDARPL